MGETKKAERNPFVDPLPRDWFQGVGPDGVEREVRVDDLRNGEVYMARFRVGAPEAEALFRMPLETFRAQAHKGRVIWHAESGRRFEPSEGAEACCYDGPCEEAARA